MTEKPKSAFETLSEFEQVRLKKELYEAAPSNSDIFTPRKKSPANDKPSPTTIAGHKLLEGDEAKYFLATIKQRRRWKRKNEE